MTIIDKDNFEKEKTIEKNVLYRITRYYRVIVLNRVCYVLMQNR